MHTNAAVEAGAPSRIKFCRVELRKFGAVVLAMMLWLPPCLSSPVTAGAQAVSFIAGRDFVPGHGPFSVAVGDFNGDGKADLAVANEFSNNVSVLLGNGDGSFQAAQNFVAGNAPVSVAVGDFNGD